MDALSVTLISAVTSGAISLTLGWVSGRQQRRDSERVQRETRTMAYLNPLRWHTAEVHHRLSLYATSVDRDGCYPPAQVLADPREMEGKGADWFAGKGVVLGSSVWMTACLFAQMTRTRHDLPFLRLAGNDDTRLPGLLQKVHAAFAACEIYYATQSSIGTDALLEPEGRLRSYREFCDLLAEPDRRVWADPVTWFLIAVAHGERRPALQRVLDALSELSAFLDDSLAGGASLRARHGAEIHRPRGGSPGTGTGTGAGAGGDLDATAGASSGPDAGVGRGRVPSLSPHPIPAPGPDPSPDPVLRPIPAPGPNSGPDPVPRPNPDPGPRPGPEPGAGPGLDAGQGPDPGP
ncbi:hypothetical protein [Streptomyces sp. NPDC127036]|uniref:hypothetical protein n=1 Tax=unclassified Streptomyces TaxID=2593676 RepID=UPI003647A299